MSQSLMAKRFFREYKLIASQVGIEVKFLKDTSCMNPEAREYIACCEIYALLFPENKEFNKFLTKKMIPSLELLGHAHWNRDILTDMGLRIGKKGAGGSLKDLRK